MSKFGTNNYGGNFTKRNRYKLKDGDNVYRILPAMGDLAKDGVWSVYYSVIFGFKTSDGKHRPFQSPEIYNRETKKVDVRCAATDMINKLKDQLKEAKDAGNKEAAVQLAKIVGDYPVMGVYSLNKDHYLNVVDRQGNVGQLELGHKAKLALKDEIDRVRKEDGFDPLSPENGRFFNIRRTGKGLDTGHNVSVVKEKVDVPGVGKVERDLVHVIDDALGDRLLLEKTNKDGSKSYTYKEAANLDTLYQFPTAEQVALIVKTADILTGKSAAVDQVLGKAPAAEAEAPAEDTAFADAERAEAEAKKATLAEAAKEAAKQSAAAENAAVRLATIEAAQSVVQETKAATAQAAAAPAAQTTAQAVAAMSPDDFMKQFGVTL